MPQIKESKKETRQKIRKRENHMAISNQIKLASRPTSKQKNNCTTA